MSCHYDILHFLVKQIKIVTNFSNCVYFIALLYCSDMDFRQVVCVRACVCGGGAGGLALCVTSCSLTPTGPHEALGHTKGPWLRPH